MTATAPETNAPTHREIQGPSGPAEREIQGWGARAADAVIRLYQRLGAGRPSPCRYWPTCSQYARDALRLHGFWRGGMLAARRLGRCRPLAASGWDPVPLPAERSSETEATP